MTGLGVDKVKYRLVVALSLVVAGGWLAQGSGINAQTTEAGKQAEAAAGHIMFEHRCRVCHADDPSLKSYGPSLIGVIGRKAGTLEGFAYSDALKASGIVWTEEALRAWMANNTGILPGTRMRHVGVTDKEEQDFLLAYIRTLAKR